MLHELTLLVVSGLVVSLCSVVFIVNATLRRDDAAGRLWCVAYLAGILLTLAFGIASAYPAAAWWTIAVGNLGMVVVVGAIWSGLRLARRNRPLLYVVMAAGAAVGLASLIPDSRGIDWSGALVTYLAIAAFAGLTLRETLARVFRHNINARVLAVVFLVICVFYLARAIAFIAYGPDDERFLTTFGTPVTTLLNLALVITSTIALSIFQSERLGRIRGTSASDEVAEMPGVLGPEQFGQVARDWMRRAAGENRTLNLVIVDLGSLDEINVAFGRRLGSEAIATVGRAAVAEAPVAAIVGHVEPSRFAVLSPAVAGENPVEIAERIQRRVLAEPGHDETGFRAACAFAVVTTRSTGFDLDGLIAAATSSLDERQEQPGSVEFLDAR